MARHTSGKSKLYPYSTASFTLSQFKTHMNNVSKYAYPGYLATPGIIPSNFVKYAKNYASSKGVTISQDLNYSELHDFWNASDYIVYNLQLNRPVAICLYQSKFSELSRFTWHWMTVTKYFRDTSDNRWVAVSSWGERHSLNWRLLHNYQNENGYNDGFYGVRTRIYAFK